MNKDIQDQPVIKIQQFTQRYLQEASTLLTKGFLSDNQVWNRFNLPYEETRVVLRGKLIRSFLSSYVILENEVVRGAVFLYDVVNLFYEPQMPHQISFFEKLSQVKASLEKSLNLESVTKSGEVMYGTFGIIDSSYKNQGISKRLWWQLLSQMKYSGYKMYCCRISSPISLKILMKFGAQIVGQAFMQSGNQQSKFWMVKLDLKKFSMNYQQFKQIFEGKGKTKPKL